MQICRWHSDIWSHPFTIWYIHPAHDGNPEVTVMVMNDRLTPLLYQSICPPIPEIRLCQTLTLKLQGQGHGCGQSAQPNNWPWPSILPDLFSFCFTSIWSQFLRYSYFEIWPSKIQDQGHGWGQRSRSHSWPRIQPMHLLVVLRHPTNHSWDLSNSV